MDYIETIVENARKAQAEFEQYNQQQVDAVVKAIGKVIYDNAEMIAKEAVEESGYGRVDSKIIKQTAYELFGIGAGPEDAKSGKRAAQPAPQPGKKHDAPQA